MNDTNQIKGISASVATVASGIAAWLPMLDTVLKIGVETFGVLAGYYAYRYWRYKWNNRGQSKGDNE